MPGKPARRNPLAEKSPRKAPRKGTIQPQQQETFPKRPPNPRLNLYDDYSHRRAAGAALRLRLFFSRCVGNAYHRDWRNPLAGFATDAAQPLDPQDRETAPFPELIQ